MGNPQTLPKQTQKLTAGGEVKEDGGDGFGVDDFVGVDGAEDFFAGEAAHGDFFVFFGGGGAGGKAFGNEDGHPLGDEAGSGDEGEKFAEAARFVAGFFVELAFGGSEGRFVRFFAAGDEFPEELVNGVAVLANHEDVAIGEDGHGDNGARVSDDVTMGLDAGGFDDEVATNAEDAALIEGFGGGDLGVEPCGHNFPLKNKEKTTSTPPRNAYPPTRHTGGWGTRRNFKTN